MAFNFAFFNMSGYMKHYTIQYVRRHDIGDCGYGGTPERLTLPNGDIFAGWTFNKAFKGIKNNKIIAVDTTTRRSRNMIGELDDGSIFTVQTTKGYTEYEVCYYVLNHFKKKGRSIPLMFVMDAGGSTGCYSTRSRDLFAPEKEGTNGRPVPSVFCVRRKTTAAKITRTLAKGMTGDDVLLLQSVIGSVEVDGIFGPMTRNQVIIVQRRLGLVPDGIVGPKTLAALGLS